MVFNLVAKSLKYFTFFNPALSSNRWTDFHALWLTQRVPMLGKSISGLR